MAIATTALAPRFGNLILLASSPASTEIALHPGKATRKSVLPWVSEMLRAEILWQRLATSRGPGPCRAETKVAERPACVAHISKPNVMPSDLAHVASFLEM
jgi:hypothetical protein